MAHSKMHFTGQVSDFDLRLLRVFKTVVESGGFTAAEVELNVSRSAISASMADLEKRLGFRLCQRGRTGFALTEAGRQVYDNTLQLLASLDVFRVQVNTLHSSLKGELRLGITDNLITMRRMRIVHSLQALKRRAPQVMLNICMLAPNEIEKGVLTGRFDIGIVPRLRAGDTLDHVPLYEEESGLYCGQDHPLFSLAEPEITPQRVLACDAVVPAHAQPHDLHQVYQRHRLSATVSDREGVALLLMTGCFIGYLPTHYAAAWVGQNVFRRLCATDFGYTTQFIAITRSGERRNPILDSYLAALYETE